MTQSDLSSFSPSDDETADDAAEAAAIVAGSGGGRISEVVAVEEAKFPDSTGTVELMVTQVDYTIEGTGREEHPVVHVFGRRADGTAEHVRVLGFEPYFYAPTDSLTEPPEDTHENLLDSRETDPEGTEFESIRGEKLTKIIGQTPRDIGEVREEFDHYEADIRFPNRFLIDKGITSGIEVSERRLDDGTIQIPHTEVVPCDIDSELRINIFDIEVDDRRGFPEDGEEPIVCLTSYDSVDQQYIAWLYEAPEGNGESPATLPEYEPYQDDIAVEVRVFDSEAAMLAAFIEYIDIETDPDLLTGWNCLPADSTVFMADGSEKEIQHVEIGDSVVGSESQQTCVTEVTNKWKSEKKIREFSLADGTSLQSSDDHRIMIGDDDCVDWKEGSEIEAGDYVLKPRRLSVEEPSVPTLSALIPRENQRYADEQTISEFKSALPHGAVSELATEFGVSTGTLYHPHRSTWTPERCRKAADRYDIPLPDGGVEYRRTGVDLKRKLTPEELYYAGLILTDGSMSPQDGIRFYNTRKELHRQFPTTSQLTPDGTGCYKQNVLDYAMMYAFNGLGIPFGDKNDGEVDLSAVYEMPTEYIGHFLAGVIDGDGNVAQSGITVAAENRSVGKWYARLFKRLGIFAQQRENTVRVPDAKRDINQIKDHVAPHMAHSEKKAAIEAFEGGISGQTENIPYALFEAETGTDAKRIGNDKHRRGINLKRHETSSDEWDEYVFVEVTDVSVTGTETTYDIETTTHNFVAEGCLVHNCDDFDIPYLLDRLEEIDGSHHDYNLSIDQLSRVDEVWRSGWGGPNIKGRVVFDLLYGYKRTQFTELDSYRLDAVAELELGVGKERYPGDIGDLWEDDPTQLLEYNLRDVELCVEINRKQGLIDFWDEVRKFVGCKLEDAPTPGDAVDQYVLHKASGKFVLPTKGKQEGEEFEGGAVFDPITGVLENVSVLDLKCFSSDTDVLTPSGPKSITEIEVGDMVYTLNPETFECEITSVAETHEYDNKFGELHHLSGNTHDFKVTENHQFLASKTRGWDEQTPADFEFTEYRDLTDSERYAFPQHQPISGDTPETFDLAADLDTGYVAVYCEEDLRWFRNRMPESVTEQLDLAHGTSAAMGIQQKVGKYLLPVSVYLSHRDTIESHADGVFLKYDRRHGELSTRFEMADWLELIGWYVSEGSIDSINGRVTLHQSDTEGRATIRSLLERMEIPYSVDDRGFNISNQHLIDWFERYCGHNAAEKRLPAWVFELDAELIRSLLDTLIDGDGSRTSSGLEKYWTISDTLKNDILDLAVRCGEKPTVSKDSDDTWYISIGKRGSFNKSTNATTEPHDDTVHCITAEENHVILAGRNGHYQWIGQSLYPMCMVTINAGPETKVGDEYDGETYHAPNGTRFRKEPDGIMREMVDELLTEREEKKSLRNQHDPDSSEYALYDTQQAAVKVIMNCFTPDTEVLTPSGVRNITELTVGDQVYSLDPDTQELEIKPVTETHAYPEYRGELVDIETSKINFRVTPNHRMLVRKNDRNGITEDGYSFVEAGELAEYCNYELPHDWTYEAGVQLDSVDLTEFVDDYEVWVRPSVHGHTFTAELGFQPRRVPKADVGQVGYVFTAEEFEANRSYIESVCEQSFIHAESGRKWIPRIYDGDDFLAFLAWYITEGNVYTSTPKQFGENYRGSATTVQLAQEVVADGGSSPTDHHAAIGDLLDRMGLDYYVDDRSYQFTSKLLGGLLAQLCGDDSVSKRIPELVFEASSEQKQRFLSVLIDGDGDRQPNSWRYSTTSEELRDDVLRLCTHLGLTANYNADSGTWRVYVTEESKNSLRMHRSSTRSTADDGVYCVTVADNHTLLAGRNGKFQFVGQSLYGVTGWDRFRLYDKEGAAAVTATGREVIDFTESVASELDYEVAYGDSVTGDRPVVVRDPDGIVRVLPIEDLFERATTINSDTVVITADGGTVESASAGKDRRRLDGWEALSLAAEGEPEWQPIQQAIRHETDKPVVKLQHKFGESTTTRDHSYVVDDDGDFIEAAPDDVDEPLRIPGLPEVETVETIDVYEIVEGYTREYEDGRSVGSENATTKMKQVHANEEWVWFGHDHHNELSKPVKVQRYIDIDSEDGAALLRLLAAYITEGSASTAETTDSRFGASIAESREEWLDGLQSDYYRLFENTKASVIASDSSSERTVAYETSEGSQSVTYNDTTAKLQLMNELSAVFFREFAGQTSRGKRIPGFVFNLPQHAQQLFLETLIEGDGSREFPRYTDEYSERHFDFETTSRELAAGVSLLLTQRGQKHSLKYRDAKDSYTIRTCDSYRSGRDPILTEVDHDGYVYDLSVAENENFVDGVGGVVLHNTDSVMLELDSEVNKTEAIEQSFDIEEAINSRYDEFAREELNAAEHRFQIEFEKLYRRFFQAGRKKRYAGHIIWKEGKDVDDIDITGFEYKRSDIAPITKQVQKEVIETIVTGDDLEADRQEVREYLTTVIEEFLNGERSVEEIGIPGGIGKRLDAYETPTAQVRGAQYANLLLGTNFDRGSKPKRLYLKDVHSSFFRRIEEEKELDPRTDPLYGEFKRDPDVICFEYADQLPEEFEIDLEKMLEKTLKGPISRVIEALDMSWDEIKTGQTQTGLEQYW